MDDVKIKEFFKDYDDVLQSIKERQEYFRSLDQIDKNELAEYHIAYTDKAIYYFNKIIQSIKADKSIKEKIREEILYRIKNI